MKKVLAVFLLLLACGAVNAQSLRGGAAVRNITPDPLLPVSGGVGTPSPATQKKGDLFVRVMVLEYQGTKVAFASLDNLGWPAVLGNKARALVKTIPPENILIGATHTHSAPDAYAFPDEKGKSYADMEYLDRCTKLIAEAIREAERNLEEVDLKVGYGKAPAGIAYNYYAPDLYDPHCGVIQLLSKKTGKPVCTLVNYAIHPEVIGSRRGILSPDVCGPLYEAIENKGGGTAVFFNGALGGMVTADNRRQAGEQNTWEECVRIGNLLGSEALKIAEKSAIVNQPRLAVKSQTVEFPVETPVMKYIMEKSPMGYQLNRENRVSTVQNFIELGPAKILTIPGEALPNIGFYLKRKMNTAYPFLFGLTNDAFGYILTRVDYGSFEKYNYITRTSLGEETGEILINESLKMINSNK